MQEVRFTDLGNMPYKAAWDYQEALLRDNAAVKARQRQLQLAVTNEQPVTIEGAATAHSFADAESTDQTTHHLLFVEHPPVYTLGKSGNESNVLITEKNRNEKGIEFFNTNRGGDITFHGPGQLVGYPILDLERFYTDIGRYLRNLEQVVIQTMAEYGLKGERSSGETGVWITPDTKGKERKICAIGVRCSRWITMHGFAFNVNTDLDYFNYIIPCGIQDKQVTSLAKELGQHVSLEEVKQKLKAQFENVFNVQLVS